MPVPAFVEALERCITELSAIVSHTSTIWADHCESPGDKTQFQAPLACEKRPGPLKTAILWLLGTALAHTA